MCIDGAVFLIKFHREGTRTATIIDKMQAKNKQKKEIVVRCVFKQKNAKAETQKNPLKRHS